MTGRNQRDPFYEREVLNYENPLPSREFILATLKEQGVPVAEQELCALLGIREEEARPFTRRLAAMEREGQIMRNRRDAICIVEKLDLVAGRVFAPWPTLPITFIGSINLQHQAILR